MSAGRLRVGVVFGGPSAEHDVSCASALGVVRALPADRFEPVVLGLDRRGDLHLLPDAAVARLLAAEPGRYAIDDRLEVSGPVVRLERSAGGAGALVVPAGGTEPVAALDVAFPVLHGPFGEDGVVQGWFEALDLPYVGCGVLASAVGIDKVATKRALRAQGLPVTPDTSFDAATWRAARRAGTAADLVAGLAYPLFVKPARMGSSIGVSRVLRPADLAEAVAVALDHDDVVVVEQGVTGRELECGVLGNGSGEDVEASVVGEVGVVGGWFDHDQKYYGDTDPMTVPARLPADVSEQVRALAVRAFAAIGGTGLARVDVFWDEGQGRLFVNELNTMPGFTAHSMYPKVWAAAGLAYPQLLARLVDLGLERHAGRTRRRGVSAAASSPQQVSA